MLDNGSINSLLEVDESYKASDVLMRSLMNEVERVQLFNSFLSAESDLSYDWFTDYFQEEHSDRKKNKQDFTPAMLVELCSRLLGKSDLCADICAGTGGLTIRRWVDNPNSSFYCEEYSDRALPFLLFNLAIRNMNAIVWHGDALERGQKGAYKLTQGEKFSSIEKIENVHIPQVDSVIMNPPYSFVWKAPEKLLKDPRFEKYGVLAPKSKADWAFILTGLNMLSESYGRMLAILPHGVLFRSGAEETIRRKVVESGVLETVIGMPGKVFLNTDIPTALLIFNMNKKSQDVLFIDASKDFTKGKNKNLLEREHVEKILNAAASRNDIERYAHVATVDEIIKNDFNLNIPRFVDTFIPEPVIPLSEIQRELEAVDIQIQETGAKIADMFSQLEATSSAREQMELDRFTAYLRKRYGKKRKRNSEQLELL